MKRSVILVVWVLVLAAGSLPIGQVGTAAARQCDEPLDCLRAYVQTWRDNPVAVLPESTMYSSSLEQEFVQAVMAAEAALQAEDAERAASCYAEDAISMPPGFPASFGREAIQADLEVYFDTFDIERSFELADYQVSGNTGVRRAEWTQTLTPTDGSEPIVETGRCILGFEKIDGEWLIVWEIWNTYEQ